MLAGAGVASSSALEGQTAVSTRPRIKLAAVSMGGDDTFQLARQMGVTHAVAGAGLTAVPRSRYVDTLAKIKSAHNAVGMTVAAVEGGLPSLGKTMLGLAGRDEEIENYIAAIEAIGKVGIPVLCYGFVAVLGWYRTRTDVRTRGGALTSEFDNRDAKKLGLTEAGEISRELLWDSFTYFLKAVVPVAEKANVKMGLHPNDPPISPLRGIGRIVTSAADYRRILNIVPSPSNGITFCQANFKAMAGDDVYEMAAEFCKQKKVFFVHFRNIDGDREHFVEKFHDDGQIDMPRMMKIYHDNGFDGPMRPDHAPTMAGETNGHSGYYVLGKIFAFGYMKGILDSLQIPYA